MPSTLVSASEGAVGEEKKVVGLGLEKKQLLLGLFVVSTAALAYGGIRYYLTSRSKKQSVAFTGCFSLRTLGRFTQHLDTNPELVDKLWAALSSTHAGDDCIDTSDIGEALHLIARLYYKAHCYDSELLQENRLNDQQIDEMMQPVVDHFVKYKVTDKPRIGKAELWSTIGLWLIEAN